MTAPPGPYTPPGLLVAAAWVELATPADVKAGERLPAPDPALRAVGFVRLTTAGGSPSIENPMRHPVITGECFVAPAVEGSSLVPWNAAGRLANWLVEATDDAALRGVQLDLGASWWPARVLTVVALGEPRKVEGDPNNYARLDVDLHFHWTALTGAT